MVFKRRTPRTWLQFIGAGFYPRGGWRRAVEYVVHRLRRLPDPPHKIARGVAAGVFVCFTPFFGFHFVLSAILAFIMQGNILASLLATFFGNPLTFPLIAALSLELGSWMLGVPGGVPLPEVFGAFSQASVELWRNFTAIFTPEVAHWDSLRVFFWRVFWPYTVGGLVPGTFAGVAAYMLALPAVRAYQNRRVKKLKERFEKRRTALKRAEVAVKPD
ncbi:MAG: DUF2062 domain-containing protein [Rhodobacter sp.]|nr:DUF2062 domain-containing protein [Rhodobacter sp.]